MSIYFVHFLQVFLPLAFLSAVFLRSFDARGFVSFGIVGVVFAFIANYIATVSLKNEQLFFVTNILILIALLLLLLYYFIPKIHENHTLASILFGFVCFSFSLRYFYISKDFPVFSTGFLETVAIISCALILLAFIISVCVFFLVRYYYTLIAKITLLCGIVGIIIFANAVLGDILLKMMRDNLIEVDSSLLSYVAKSIHYAFLNPYIFATLALVLGIISLFKMPKHIHKTHPFDTEYRKEKGFRDIVVRNCFTDFGVFIISIALFAYFDLYASKPLAIDTPTDVEPQNGFFTFPTDLLADNNLHRFAYVTDEGKEVRFFLINKFENRSSPVAVFDSCMLCGDMGYIKRGGELICVACNVRIFLPSVGKFGGCNPIPLDYEVKDGVISIKLEDVVAGSNYFTKTREKKVKDPVSGATFNNQDAPYKYAYKGINYYFENQNNYDLFVKEPEKYTQGALTATYRIQRHHDESNNN